MTLSHQELYGRYLHAGAITRDPDAVAALFTEDGTYDAPLVAGDPLIGRDAIRAGIGEYQQDPSGLGTPNFEKTGFVLHDTVDPDVFIAEIDAAFDSPEGPRTMSLVQIFRVRDGRIASLRDYFRW